MDKQEALKIAEDFLNSLKAGDRELIEKYTVEQLRMSLSQFMLHDQRQLWYQEILKRIDELQRKKENERHKKNYTKEKVELVILSFLFGIIGTLITQWILKK